LEEKFDPFVAEWTSFVKNSNFKEILSVTDEESFSNMGLSGNGKTIWLYSEGAQVLSISSNEGADWKTGKIMSSNKQSIVDISTVACSNNNCYVLAYDNSIVRIENLDTKSDLDYEHILSLPDNVSASGYLITDHSGDNLFYIESDSNYGYSLDLTNKEWSKLALGVDGSWYAPELLYGKNNYVLRSEDKAVIVNPATQDIRTFHPLGWDDYEVNFCSDESGKLLYAYTDIKLAVSFDAGNNWQTNQEILSQPPYCAINNKVLWIKYQGTHVYQLP